MNALLGVIIALAYLAPVILTVVIADRKGLSFIGFMLFALAFWPAALVVVLVTKRRDPSSSSGPSAPGWFPDPAGRHDHRYFDGAAWTTRVRSNNSESVDAL